jgi:AraC-like DNA-binding protein
MATPSSLLARIDEYLSSCYARESVARTSELAEMMGVSRQHLLRMCRSLCGRSPRELLRERQLRQAILLLGSTGLSLRWFRRAI